MFHRSSQKISFPVIIDPEVPLIRPPCHVLNSIATIHRLLMVEIANTLQRSQRRVCRFPASRKRKF
jgi:hypothetical protein